MVSPRSCEPGRRSRSSRLNMDRGVLVEPFPQQWRCKTCGSITRVARRPVSVRRPRSRGQMQFIAYHTCGAARQPLLPQVPAPTTRWRYDCRGPRPRGSFGSSAPSASAPSVAGVPVSRCATVAAAMSVTVHRAAVVFSPRFAVLVNPPDPAVAARLRAGGGGARALEWVLDGMTPTTRRRAGRPSRA